MSESLKLPDQIIELEQTIKPKATIENDPATKPADGTKPLPKAELELKQIRIDIWTKIATFRLTLITAIITTASIAFTAGWTYVTFNEKDLPEINRTFSMETSIRVDSLSEKRCVAMTNISINNVGKKDMFIDSILVYRWIVPSDIIGAADYFDINHFIDTNSKKDAFHKFKYGYDSNNLLGRHVFENKTNYDFPIIFERNYANAIVYKIDMYGRRLCEKKEAKIILSHNEWIAHCIPD